MNLGIYAQSGWGKGYVTQAKIEKNLGGVDFCVVCDPKDEYRGLVADGPCAWHPAGPAEQNYSVSTWATIIKSNPFVVIPAYDRTPEQWRQTVARIGEACRKIYADTGGDGKILLVIDEAHEVAPQDEGYPEAISQIAVRGRGEMISSIWITQRTAKLDKDIVSQCMARYAGGFQEPNDRDALGIDGYPREVHNPNAEFVPNLPEPLQTDSGESIPVRKFTDSAGNVTGSEWIYSDETGTIRRENSANYAPKITHYGKQGFRLNL